MCIHTYFNKYKFRLETSFIVRLILRDFHSIYLFVGLATITEIPNVAKKWSGGYSFTSWRPQARQMIPIPETLRVFEFFSILYAKGYNRFFT
jgi:hypothetical protein